MQKNQSGFLSSLKFRYLPYWPLFVILILLFLSLAYVYIRITPPVYNIAATMSVKDERKGVEDSKLLESLNIYNSKTIVENETEVLQSKTLMRNVIRGLKLYAPVSQQGRYRLASAYVISPVVIEAQNPDSLTSVSKVFFTFHKENGGSIQIGKVIYPMNAWVNTPYGVLKFTSNPYQTSEPTAPLFFSLDPVDKVANTLIKSLQVSTSSKTSTIMELSFKDEVPKRGENILNGLIKSYTEASIKQKNLFAEKTLSVLDERVAEIGKELTAIESKIQQYKQQQGVVDLSEQSKVYLQNAGLNDQKVADINMQMAALDNVENYTKSSENTSGTIPSTVGINNPGLTVLVENLYTAELDYEKQKKITGENNPIVVSLHDRIDKLKPLIYVNIKSQRETLKASRNNLASTNSNYSSTLQTIPQKEKDLLSINREQAIKSSEYSFLLQKRDETQLTYASTVADSRVVDYAQAEEKPVSPKKSFVFLAALVAALGLGACIVSAREMFSNKVLFRNEIEEFSDIPVVAELTYSKSKEPIAINQPDAYFITEQFRHLRASIGLFSNKNLQKKILVTSSIAGEGKSFVSNNLAVSLAATRKKVVLVDLDLRNPKTSELFGVHKKTGTINFLDGECTLEEIVTKTNYKNLSVVPVGIGTTDPTELLLDEKLNHLFHYLEAQFDYIIVDTAPVEPVADAYLLSEYCDMTLFVVRHGYTPKAIIQNLQESGKMKDLKNPVIVFNSVKGRGLFKKGYGRGYGYGNRYQYDDNTYKPKAIGDKES